jgi:hypothetical protein
VGENAAMAGMLSGLATMLAIKVFQAPIAFTWYVVIGTTITFTVGYLASLVFPLERQNG